MQSIHVVPTIDNEASGPSYCVTRLCQSLLAAGHPTRLGVLDPLPPGPGYGFATAFPYGIGPRRLGISPSLRDWVRAEARSEGARILHNHSLWMETNVYAAAAARGTACRLVVSPHGTFASRALERSSLTKKALWPLFVTRATRGVAAFHATAEHEYADIRASGFRQPVAVLPNGIDLPEALPKAVAGRRQLLFLGRIHEIKGIDRLLRAWAVLQDRHPDWDLVLAGPDEGGHRADMERLAAELGLERHTFVGPLYGPDKLAAYRAAELYVLPTLSENFGMTVAEALAAGTPVVTTKGAPWSGLETEGAGWWIDHGVEPLVAVLDAAMSEPAELLARRGMNGRDWMARDFSWDRIATDMAAFYAWLADGGAIPPFVKLD
ncbi:glycosyltransferase involved in cell wall biosynthesis [Amorphus suaedae]